MKRLSPAKLRRLQRRLDIANLNAVVRTLKRFGDHDTLAAASLALWCIAAPARAAAQETTCLTKGARA